MVIELNENGFKVTVLEETDNYTFPENSGNFVLSLNDKNANSFLI